MKLTLFTDGSCLLNKQCGGAGVYFQNKNELKIQNISKSFKGSDVTNQRMELMACLLAIEKIIKCMGKKILINKNTWELDIYTDSMYVINCVTKWSPKWILYNWKRLDKKELKNIKHVKIIQKLYKLSKLYPINYYHVKSHQKEPPKDDPTWTLWYGNNIADKLAGTAMKKLL